jgi:hypothetical protein
MGMDVILEIFLSMLVNSESEISKVAILAREKVDKPLKTSGMLCNIKISK